MGGNLSQKLRIRQGNSSRTPADITPCNGRSQCTDVDSNGNHLLGCHGYKSSAFVELPLADKRVNVESAQSLLSKASLSAQCDLMAAGNEPNLQELSTYSFPFENAAFEGGGVKGIAYVGAIKCLEDVGIRMKRFAGSSIGATVAGLLSVGYTADELVPLYVQDLSIFIKDNRSELLCIIPRVISKMGVYSGKSFTEWYGRCLALKTQDPDITFRQIYDRFGTELCMVALNMNTGREEYFHPKTTPDISVKIVARMAISVPGVLEPVRMFHADGGSDLYIDGGVVCNYPIYVFDGWWLSMEPPNQVYNKLYGRSEEGTNSSTASFSNLSDSRNRFGQRNDKTLGFKQTTNNDFFNDTFIHSLIGRDVNVAGKSRHILSRPNTKLAKKRLKHLQSQEKAAEAKSRQLRALLKLFEVLQKCSNAEGHIIKDRLLHTLSTEKEDFTDHHRSCLFGKDIKIETVVRTLPTCTRNMISPNDLHTHFQRFGLDIYRILESSSTLRAADMDGAKSFWATLQHNVTSTARRSFVKPEDLDRTVNIHIDYIKFLDFEIRTRDKEFLIQQGYKHTLLFLQRYMQKKEVFSTPEPLLFADSLPAEQSQQSFCSTVEQPMFYMDEDISYDEWLCGLTPDNVTTR